MIYLEYDDGHNEPHIYEYDGVDECVRCVLGARPTMESGRFGMGPYVDRTYADGTTVLAVERLAEDQADWDEDHGKLMSLICDADADGAEWEANINLDTYRRVDAGEMERRAEMAKMQAVAMRKGIKLP